VSLTATQTDELAGKIARLALTWAGDDPDRLAQAIEILEGAPCLGTS